MANGGPGCASTVQNLASETAQRTGAAYVVVIDLNRVRHSHPDPALIGQKVSEPHRRVRDGKVHLRIDPGATGVNANARAPLYGPNGALAGEVSVGIRESSVSTELLSELPTYAVVVRLVALAIGALASFALASRMKRRTFGLELDEIARLLQEREATLHGIREGVHRRRTRTAASACVNDEAQRLLRLSPNASGRRLDDVLAPGPLLEALAGTSAVTDVIVITDDYWLVINRMPVILGGRPHGSVITLQDRTGVEALTRELDGERSLTESMRAQQHEFSNRMHVIAGLLELGRPDGCARLRQRDPRHLGRPRPDAPHPHRRPADRRSDARQGRGGERARHRSRDPPDTNLGEAPGRVQALTTILGNLIDNAFDALASTPPPRRVRVGVVESDDALTVTVGDNGPGVSAADAKRIFRNGYTTKRGSLVRHSGLGLSLVHNTVTKLGGSVSVTEGPGATFTVILPKTPARTPVRS